MRRMVILVGLIVIMAILSGLIIMAISASTTTTVQSFHLQQSNSLLKTHRLFQCPVAHNHDPKHKANAANNKGSVFENEYYNTQSKLLNMNFTTFFSNVFNVSEYDNWGFTYHQFKKGMTHWKSTMFADELNDGDSIYESACGIGLNLYMTLEILHEVKQLSSLVVYGNDYLDLSRRKANDLFEYAAPFQSQKGSICTGDSTHLDFVPSNAFDLVFCGYILPMHDPLGLNKTDRANYKEYSRMCKSKDAEVKKLSDQSQKKQNDFYGVWVGEMVRIAKPGKAIIIEQVSLPYCQDNTDYGGVALEWWEMAIDEYGWDIDPTSITMENDTLYPGDPSRYHVFMRKKR
eukprot:1339_1